MEGDSFGCWRSIAGDIEQHPPRHRQETLHIDIDDRSGIEQGDQQLIGRYGRQAPVSEQDLPRQRLRP